MSAIERALCADEALEGHGSEAGSQAKYQLPGDGLSRSTFFYTSRHASEVVPVSSGTQQKARFGGFGAGGVWRAVAHVFHNIGRP